MSARSVNPDRLREGDDPDTVFASDARHWIAVYREMIGFNEELLGRLGDQLKRLPRSARDGAVDNDVSLIAGQDRKSVGWGKSVDLGGRRIIKIKIDDKTRTVAYHE